MRTQASFVIILMTFIFISACKSKQSSTTTNDPLMQLEAIWTAMDTEITAQELADKLSQNEYISKSLEQKDSLKIRFGSIEISKKTEFDQNHFLDYLTKSMHAYQVKLVSEKGTDENFDFALSIDLSTEKGKQEKEKFVIYSFKLDLRDPNTYTTLSKIDKSVKKYL